MKYLNCSRFTKCLQLSSAIKSAVISHYRWWYFLLWKWLITLLPLERFCFKLFLSYGSSQFWVRSRLWKWKWTVRRSQTRSSLQSRQSLSNSVPMLTTSCQVKIFNCFTYLEVNKPIDKHRLKFLADKFYHFIFLKAFYSVKSMTCFFNGYTVL